MSLLLPLLSSPLVLLALSSLPEEHPKLFVLRLLLQNKVKPVVRTLHKHVHVVHLHRSIVEEAIQCKKKILQNDGVVTSPCARPRKAGHTLLILGGQTFMCDKIYQVKILYSCLTSCPVWSIYCSTDLNGIKWEELAHTVECAPHWLKIIQSGSCLWLHTAAEPSIH